MLKKIFFSLVMISFFMCGLPAQSPTQPLWWDANTEADLSGYWMYRSLTPCTDTLPAPNTCSSFAKIHSSLIPQAPDPVNFVDTGPLQFQTHYYYRVTAVNTSDEESLFSNELDTIHANPNAPAAPGTLRGNEQGANMWLDWDDMDHVRAYNVYKSEQANEVGNLIVTLRASEFKDTNPGRIGPRWYNVTSVNDFGESEPSGPIEYKGK
jgi:hypothetical protein